MAVSTDKSAPKHHDFDCCARAWVAVSTDKSAPKRHDTCKLCFLSRFSREDWRVMSGFEKLCQPSDKATPKHHDIAGLFSAVSSWEEPSQGVVLPLS